MTRYIDRYPWGFFFRVDTGEILGAEDALDVWQHWPNEFVEPTYWLGNPSRIAVERVTPRDYPQPPQPTTPHERQPLRAIAVGGVRL